MTEAEVIEYCWKQLECGVCPTATGVMDLLGAYDYQNDAVFDSWMRLRGDEFWNCNLNILMLTLVFLGEELPL